MTWRLNKIKFFPGKLRYRPLPDHLVDVGLPAYGSGAFICEAVESVLAQTFQDWRLLISDNGAGGGAIYEKVRRYLADPRVHYSPSGHVLQAGENFTRASEGRAPFVTLLHDDDRWGPEWLERRVSALSAHPGCGFAFGECNVIDQHGHTIGRSEACLPDGVYPSSAFLPVLYDSNVVPVTSVLMRRECFHAVGPNFEEFPFRDHELWLRLAARFPVVYLKVWDSDYRIHESQTSWEQRLQAGVNRLRLVDAVEPWIPVSLDVKRKVRANAHLSCSLDAVERGSRADALRQLSKVLGAGALLLRQPDLVARAAVALTALAAGPVGRAALTRSRFNRWRRHSHGWHLASVANTSAGDGLLQPR